MTKWMKQVALFRILFPSEGSEKCRVQFSAMPEFMGLSDLQF